MSDDQIKQFVNELKKRNLSLGQIDDYAAQKGLSEEEVTKLKERIVDLGLDKELSNSNKRNTTDSVGRKYNKDYGETELDSAYYWQDRYKKIKTKEDLQKEIRRQKIFGTELFSNKNLTFEPNLRIATPPNYKLGTEDELVINVYGYSEKQDRVKVSPEGYVLIPNLGPIYVNGLTMAEASKRITAQLSSIYAGIKTGNTSVQVSLGNIRSIRVLLIGEITLPGTYTLPSLATVANALYVSGGPNENGSFRSIQVVRNGQVIATFDLYDFLIRGDLTNNLVLQDQDIVKVNPYVMRVELAGQIKRAAIFEAKEGETLKDIIGFAGGFTDSAYTDMIRATRMTNKARMVLSVPADSIASFKLKTGDKFFVDSVLSRYTNRVTIAGAVFHPGDYSLDSNMTLRDLIKKADGLQEMAVTTRGTVRRLQDDYTPAYINFNVANVINGTETFRLQREDSVIIFSKLKLREQYLIKIDGEVNNPGYYLYGDSMHLEDLIMLAGGLSNAASTKHVEISRRIHNGDNYDSTDIRMAVTRQFDLNADLSGNTEANHYVLEPFDEVMIRRLPSYSEQANVIMDGEIVYPGIYTINNKKERISDIIRRAGGLRPEASAEGAVLLRRTFMNKADSTFLSNKLEVFYNKLRDSTNVERVRDALHKKIQLLGIEMDKALANPGSKYDLYLEEGDVIRVPKKLQTVQLYGEVYFPKKVRFDKNFSFRDYIRGAGGFTATSLKRRSYIVYANGEVKSTRKVLFFNRYPKVKPGAEIYVPPRKLHQGLSSGEAIGLASALASVALVIVTIINSTK